jgi:very-short-patch-repair endonuclease
VLPAALVRLLDDQAGVVARRQALRAGLTQEAWDWRLARDWQSPCPGVAVAHRGTATPLELAWAAVLLGPDGAALTGTWALRLHGMRLEPGAASLLVPSGSACRPRVLQPSMLAVRPARCARLDVLRHPTRRPPVVRVAPAVLHAASGGSRGRATEWVLAAAVQQRLVTPAALRAELDDAPVLPHRRLLLATLDDVELGAHAQTELDLLAVLRGNRLPVPDRLQLRVRDGRGTRYLDAWWERQRVVVEVDGAHHRDAGEWEADLLRANALQVQTRGDRVLLLRLTGAQLRNASPDVVRQLQAALR